MSLGYDVHAMDASKKLAALASDYICQPVTVSTFKDYKSGVLFDGIWACASLLHVPKQDLFNSFANLSSMLKPTGFFYCSFKYGTGSVDRGGRHFTDLNELNLKLLIEKVDLEADYIWITADARPGRESEKWINAILKKNNG